jgi:hypothetical protein
MRGFHAAWSPGANAEKRGPSAQNHGLHLQSARLSRHSGRFSDKDASLRTRQVKLIGDYAITYWVDSPVKAVMVVDVRRADR